MARPKKKLTSDNAFWALLYFQEAMKKSRLNISQQENAWEASQTLEEIVKTYLHAPLPEKENQEQPLVGLLQAWIDRSITATEWGRFLTLQRQKNFKQSKKHRVVSLDQATYLEAYAYSKELDVTLKEAVRRALAIAREQHQNAA